MVNYLAQMSWNPPGDKELFTLAEACTMFDLAKVSKSPAIFDMQRLTWFNRPLHPEPAAAGDNGASAAVPATIRSVRLFPGRAGDR